MPAPFPRTRAARRVALALVPLALLGAAFPATGLLPGWRIVARTTVTNGAGGSPAATSTMTMQLLGGRARVDMEGGPSREAMGKGGYMLLDAASGRTMLVNPAEKKALVMDGDMMGGAMGPMMDISVTDVDVQAQDIGAGGTYLGYRTRKHRVRTAYTLRITMKGAAAARMPTAMPPQVVRTVTEGESEVSAEITSLDPAFDLFGERFMRGMAQGTGMRQLSEAMRAKWPKGLALRSRLTTTTSIEGGPRTTATNVMEVTELRRAEVDPAALRLPAGYEAVEMSRLMQQRPARGRPAAPARP